MQMPFGKYRGKDLRDIPSDYLRWLIHSNVITTKGLREAVNQELIDRAPQNSWGSGRFHDPPPPPPPPPPSPPPAGRIQIYVPRECLALLAELVESGFRQLALKRHPDRGGTNEGMQELSELRDTLRMQLGK